MVTLFVLRSDNMLLRTSVVLLFLLSGCATPARTGRLIEEYARAQCIPVSTIGLPPERRWDHAIRVNDGTRVHLTGAENPGGRITLRYMPSDEMRVAVDPGDYIYPSDVRLSAEGARLYVRADGAPAYTSAQQSWLFEYDVAGRRLVAKQQVLPDVLPERCPPDT